MKNKYGDNYTNAMIEYQKEVKKFDKKCQAIKKKYGINIGTAQYGGKYDKSK